MLEILAHLPLEEAELPASFRLLLVEQVDEVKAVDLQVPTDLALTTNELVSQQTGDAWLESRASALARVPSAIMPFTWNFLLNPLHPEAKKLRIISASDHLYDPRLLRVR